MKEQTQKIVSYWKTLEDFFNSENGEPWRKMIEDYFFNKPEPEILLREEPDGSFTFIPSVHSASFRLENNIIAALCDTIWGAASNQEAGDRFLQMTVVGRFVGHLYRSYFE